MKFSEINASNMYFRLKEISGCENVLSKIRGLIKLKKKKKKIKKHVEHFFSVFEVKYFSIKELLHKLAEIQKNIAGTLSGKLKRRISWALSYEILPPEITKM